MNTHSIPFALPDIDDAEINEVVDTLRSGWITTGPKVNIFEKAFAKYIGVDYALAVNSATSGLHLALEAIGLKAGDKVITTTFTFASTAEVVNYLGAEPIFCDIDLKTFNIDVNQLERLCQKLCEKDGHNIKAIMPVHFAGQACNMTEIKRIAEKFSLLVVEDAAHALPSTHKNKNIGTFGDITVYSFYATKTLTTGEGGMIVTNNAEYNNRMSIMRLHGFSTDTWDRYHSEKSSWYYEIVAPGYKYNMTDIAAAMGIHQLKKCSHFFEKRNRIATKYYQELSGLENIELPFIDCHSDKHAFHLFVIKVKKGKRNDFYYKMKEYGVGCSVHFIPLHMQPYWKNRYNFKDTDFPNALNCFNEVLSLPIYTRMTNKEIQQVIEAVKKSHVDLF